jgi:hypothetical protein
MAQLWTCPYCNRPCTVDDADVRIMSNYTSISKEYGYYSGLIKVIVCPNPQCRQQTIHAYIYECNDYGNIKEVAKPIYSWNLLPESEAKPFPDYIPKQLRADYSEACLIRNKSPKASATLSRRCLQGMIRDFWGITKERLVDEIDELKPKLDNGTWEAINSVRHVGNIGAHMEKDVNLIIDVEPDEARLLIWLIETLFEEWYVARHNRDMKMRDLIKLAADKKAIKSAQITPSPPIK